MSDDTDERIIDYWRHKAGMVIPVQVLDLITAASNVVATVEHPAVVRLQQALDALPLSLARYRETRQQR